MRRDPRPSPPRRRRAAPGRGDLSGLALLAALGLVPTAIRAELCRATASGTWGPIAGGSIAWDCGAGAPDAGDHFLIPSGVAVTVVADVLQSPISSAGVTVASGGTLAAAVSLGSGALTLAVGAAGLDCAGACSFAGGYRTLSTSPPALEPALESPGAVWPVGAVVPCGGDCAARPQLVRFTYAPVPKIQASLSRIDPASDVVCFWDPAPGDPSASPEVNQCWAIAAVGSSGSDAWLELDVRQGRRNQSGFPLVRREIRELQASAPVAAGARRIEVDGTLLGGPAENGRFAGRWLRFADPGGLPIGVPLKILWSEDGGAGGDDALVLGDLRGAPSAHAGGELLWIDHGWAPGEPFAVMAPVRVTSATPGPGDSPIRFRGAATLHRVVFDDVREVECSACALDLREYWLVDPTGGGGSALRVTGTVGAQIHRGCQSGGDDRSGSDVTHAFTIPSNVDLHASDVSIRHHGDDAVGMGAGTTTGVLERIHVAMRSDHADSCNCINNTGAHPHRMTMRDVVCDDATDDNPNFQMSIAAGGGSTLEGALVWGSRGSVVNNSSPQRLEVRDLLVVGVDTQVGSPLLPDTVAGFVVRDSVQRNAAGTADLCLSNQGTLLEVLDGVVRDVRMAGPTFCAIGSLASGRFENVGFVNAESGDPTCLSTGGATCSALRLIDPRGLLVRDVSLVWQDAVATSLSRGVHVQGNVPAPGDLALDGLLVHGFRGTGADEALSTVDAATIFDPSTPVFGPCLSANDSDGNADFEANAPATTWRGPSPGFYDLPGYRVDTLPGSPADQAGCGVRRGVEAPGIQGFRWMHAVSRLAPERLADDADADGVPEDASAPTCADGEREGCSDSCPSAFDPGQGDADADGLGDACDAACDDGSDDDGDGFSDFPADPGCDSPEDASEHAPHPGCDDGIDDDGDLAADAADPGCFDPEWPREDPACDDGIDNDGDGQIDGADSACSDRPWRDDERRRRCGLGAELAPVLVLLARAARRQRFVS